MSLSPIYCTSHIYKSAVAKSTTLASNKVQLFLDYDCPFSAKIFKKLTDEVIPEIDSKHPGKFEFIFMNVPQPWHPTSTLMHEVALALGKLQAQSFWEFSKILFQEQTRFFDSESYSRTSEDIHKELISIATANFQDLSSEDLLNLVKVESSGGEPSNKGNKMGQDMKYFIRYHRTLGVHATPTIAVNGIINPSIESSNSPEDIIKKLESYLPPSKF